MIKYMLAMIGLTLTALAATSHPPLRTVPPPVERPLPAANAYYVDSAKGDDSSAGTVTAPWRTIQHGLDNVAAGDTLVIRGGTYYEELKSSGAGQPEAPITIRAYPGERVIVSGGWAEFADEPAAAWEAVGNGEYRSTRSYPNQRNVLGWFGDSMIGLNTYFHAQDLRAERHVWHWDDWEKRREMDAAPLYCGPGLWYDNATGRLHARLAHTKIDGIPNYSGETDPRQLPLVIAPFRSVPLTLDGARHIRIQDLELRGAGYDTIVINHSSAVTMENVTVWCGTYGLRVTGTPGLKLLHSRFYGGCPPWLSRGDTSKRNYPSRPFRDITRLNTHAHLVPENGREFSVFATPVNDDWEIAHCTFTDAHDGPYIGGVSMHFHHNLIENTQDDGIYLSPMYPRHLYDGKGATIHVYANIFRQTLTALAFGGPEQTRDTIYIYRNLIDQRQPVFGNRPSSQSPEPGMRYGKIIGDHGSPPWPTMYIYQNTFICDAKGNYIMALLVGSHTDRPRRIFNNLMVNENALHIPLLRKSENSDVESDYNLIWSPATDLKTAQKQLQRTRRNTELDANTVLGAPNLQPDASIGPDSAAIDSGKPLPAEWPDLLKDQDQGAPDIGALPHGVTGDKLGPQASGL